jgi:hypothetical protein
VLQESKGGEGDVKNRVLRLIAVVGNCTRPT